MQRREWLTRLAATGLLAGSAGSWRSAAWAAPGAADTRLLLVFLRGGYDAANVLVPAGSDHYFEARRKIALRRPPGPGEPDDPSAAISLAEAAQAAGLPGLAGRALDGWALHPALRASLLPLWQRGELAFVPFAGSADLSRSHFETQESLEAGLALPGDAVSMEDRALSATLRGSGFMGRLAQALGGQARPVSFTDTLPLAFAGAGAMPNVSLRGTGRPPFNERQTGLLAQMYQGTRFEAAVAEGFALRQTVAQAAEALQVRQNAMARAQATQQEMQAASRSALTATGFELEARRMAALMREHYRLGFIDVGGWDTHVNQGGAQGQLANLLDNLGRGLAAFADECGPAWHRTMVVVVSEFGRTFRENGTGGTDHGHGCAYWVLGGGVRGGRLVGEQVQVAPGTLHQNREWPVLNDHRAVLGGLMRHGFSLPPAALNRVFPGARPVDLGLV